MEIRKFLHDHRFPSFGKVKNVLPGYCVLLVLSIVVGLLSEDLMRNEKIKQEKTHSNSGLFLVHIRKKCFSSANPSEQ